MALQALSSEEKRLLVSKYGKLSEKPASERETLYQYIRRKSPRHPPPWHLQQLIKIFQRASEGTVRALVSMPPRHGKTFTVRHALAWLIGLYPDRLNGLVMYNSEKATQNSNIIRRMAVDDGVVLDPASQRLGYWATERDGGLSATGIDGSLTGTGFGGVMVCDDLLKGREQAESKTEREKAWDIFAANAMTRMQPPNGSVIVIATRWHEDDVTGRIIDKMKNVPDFPQFEVLNLPAIRDADTGEPNDDGVALWPEQFPLDGPLGLIGTRAVMGPYNWWSLYQGVPRPKGGTVFKSEPGRYIKPTAGGRIILSADCAGTESDRSDYTAVSALNCVGFGELMSADVLEMERWQLEPQDVAPRVLAFQRKWGGGILWIEATRDGKAIAKALKALQPSIRIGLVPPIGDKFTRAQPVAAAWNRGLVRVPMEAPWLADFLEEIYKFTGLGDKHDDQVDSLSQGWNRAVAGARAGGAQTTGSDRAGIY